MIRSEGRIDGGQHASHLYCGYCAHHPDCRERSELRLPGGLWPLWRRPLLPAMSSESAGRAETPSAGFFQNARKGFWLASISLTALVIAPGAVYLFLNITPPPLDAAAKEIKAAGFDPVVPPSRLRTPGALYQVEHSSYIKVCDVRPAQLEGKLKKSQTENRIRTRLEKGGFWLAGELLDSINGRLSADLLTSIQFRLTNVAVSEIALADLKQIQRALLSEPDCNETVRDLIKDNKKVCSGRSALSATTLYRVRIASNVSTREGDETKEEDRRPSLERVKTAIEQQAGSAIEIRSADELVGDDLFYGIKLWERCITSDTATEPSVLTQTPQTLGSERSGLIKKTAVH